MFRLDIIVAIERDLPTQESFMSQLRLLHNFCNEIKSFYHEYDYNPATPGNGFRTMVKICDIYFKKLLEQHKLANLTAHPDVLQEYQTFAGTLIKSLSISMMIRRKGVDFDATSITEDDTNIFKKLFAITPEDVQPLFNNLSCFFYKQGIQGLQRTLLFIWHYLNSSARERLGMLARTSASIKHRADIATSLTVSKVKILDSIFPSNTVTRLVSGIMSHFKGTTIHRTTVECFNKYEIVTPDPSAAAAVRYSLNRSSVIETYFVLPKDNTENRTKSIILHCPGGGYIMGHPEPFMMVMTKYAEAFSVPVVLLNYAKAPKHPFPSPIQELLDLFLFLTSHDERVIEFIGFHPDNVILSGDSAGASIAMSAIIAMHRIRKQHKASIQMPHSLCTWYPYFLPTFVAVPSYALLAVCPMTQAGALATINPAYAGVEPDDDLWYKTSRAADFMRESGHRVKDPLYNNFAFHEFEDLKHIDFYAAAPEMDPLLDQAVMMAKRWKGRVVLDVIPDVSHAFNMFPHHPSLQAECAVVTKHYSMALGQRC